MMATIHDVANRAGVSVATVSRLLNGEGNVRPATAARVRAAVAELRYTPNLLGRNLRQGATHRIIVLLNTLSNQFYSRVVKGIEEAARRREYTVMVCMTHGDWRLEESYLNLLKTRLVDGAVLLTVEQDGESLSRTFAGFPAVQACEPKEGFDAPSVSIDNERAAYEAACYLLEKGHRRVAFCGAGSIYPSSRQREAGFRRALAERSLPLPPEWVLDEGFSVNAGRRAAERLLRLEELPTAVFCISDSAAAGAVRALGERGIRVPGGLSVMGFDNTQISEVCVPALTTIRQPQYDIGFQAMELLFRRIDRKPIRTRGVILPHAIIERESVCPAEEASAFS